MTSTSFSATMVGHSPVDCENIDLDEYPYGLQPVLAGGGTLRLIDDETYQLSIPAGPGSRYRLAQLDNYGGLRRSAFPHSPPFELRIEARSSARTLPGTWGFGVWNDPFGMGALAGKGFRWPALPNCAWFFFASPQNYLSLRDDLPANGALGAAFSSPLWPVGLLALGAPALALMLAPSGRRLLRRWGRGIVRQDAVRLEGDPSEWHEYRLDWQEERVYFFVDGASILQSVTSPRGRLGLVVWIDNQYAALPPDGKFNYGVLPNSTPAWIEVRGLMLEH